MKAKLWEQVGELLASQENQDALDLLTILLTPEERSAVGSRLAIIRALMAGEESQRDISARLGVSIATITRGSNMLKTLDERQKDLIAQPSA